MWQNDNEHSKMCECNGVAVFGRKFLSGKPGAGTTASIAQLRHLDNMEIGVSHLVLTCAYSPKVDCMPDMLSASAAGRR